MYALKQAACKIPYPPVSKANPSALGAPQPNDASRNVSGSNVAESKEVNTATQPPAQQPPAQATSYLLKEVYQCWWDTQTEMNVKELESLLNHLSRWHNAKVCSSLYIIAVDLVPSFDLFSVVYPYSYCGTNRILVF